MAYTYEYTMEVRVTVKANSEEEALELIDKDLESLKGDVKAEVINVEDLENTDDPELQDEAEDAHLSVWERNQ